MKKNKTNETIMDINKKKIAKAKNIIGIIIGIVMFAVILFYGLGLNSYFNPTPTDEPIVSDWGTFENTPSSE